MMKLSATEKKVLKEITPPKKAPPIVATTLKKVQDACKRKQVLATVVLGGSLAKNTYLKGDHDVDVFVRFSPSYDDEHLSDLLEKVLHGIFQDVVRVHGSRDYFHVQQGEYLFEFVPVLQISSWVEARNVTDMSPLHVQYVTQHIDKKPELADNIRLTKQFCKAAKVYGAESYIGGFSGHVIDLLNIHYGGFHELLAAAVKWPAKVVLDPEHHLTNPMEQLNDAKLQAPLVIVDPVQPDRNSAAAVTATAFNKFRTTAKMYIKAPEKEQKNFFIIKNLSKKEFSQENKDSLVLAVELLPLPGKKDVVGAKCFKVYQYFVQQIINAGFTLVASKWEFSQRALLLFALKKEKLPADEEVVGPPIHKTADVARFKAVHKTTFTKDQRICAVEKRKFRDPEALLKSLLQQSYVRERVKKAVLL